jgi:hypothetical protein
MARIDWKSIVGTVAPTLATALGGPLAGMAASAVSQAVLGKPDATETELEQAIGQSNDPDVLLKLKQADLEFSEKMRQLDIDLEGLAAEDRESARQREVILHDYMPKALALFYTIAYFAVLWQLWEQPVKKEAKELINTLFGILSAAQMAIIGYYFGSSAGSAKKSEIMESISMKKP